MLKRQKNKAQERTGHDAEPQFVEDDVGRLLRRSRESYGQDLRRVADALRIRYVYLDAIEKSHHDRLPGAAYAVGFVRSYAEFLGLDGDDTVARYKREIAGVSEDRSLHFPTPAPESKVPSGAVFLICAILAGLAYGSWYYLSSKDVTVAELVPELPDRLQNLVDDGQQGGTVTAGESAEAPPAAQAPTPTAPPVEAQAAENLSPTPESSNQSGNQSGTMAAVQPEASVGADSEVSGASESPSAPEVSGVGEVEPQTIALSPVPQVPVETIALPDPPPASVSAPVSAPVPTLAVGPEATPTPLAVASGQSTDTGLSTVVPEGSAGGEEVAALPIPSVPESGDDGQLAPGAEVEPTGEVFGAENEDAQVVIRAIMDCWVQVRDGEGESLLTRVLRPGDVYRVPNQSGLTLMMGNAGGLVISVEGVALPPFGPVGAVRRDVSLDPEALVAAANQL